MIQQLFTALGFGSATVETTLASSVVMPGALVRGMTTVTGGVIDQQIDQLNLTLATRAKVYYGKQFSPRDIAFLTVPLARDVAVAAGSRSDFSFQFQIHPETPLTRLPQDEPAIDAAARKLKTTSWRNAARVWLHTSLIMRGGAAHNDRDDLFVQPTGPQLVMFQALEQIGLIHVKSDVDHGRLHSGRVQTTIGCYQEFDYWPQAGRFAELAELEVSFVPTASETAVILQVDRRKKRDTVHVLNMPHATYHQIDWAFEVQQLLRH